MQFTDNLQSSWIESVNAETANPVNDIWERVTVEDHAGVAEATNRFGRVIVIQN